MKAPPAAERAQRERRRVLLLFGLMILPPLVLLGALAAVAASNDADAARYEGFKQARAAALEARAAFEQEVLRAEDEVLAAIDPGLLRRRDAPDLLLAAVASAREAHPLALEFFAASLEESGQEHLEVILPDPRLPYRLRPGQPAESLFPTGAAEEASYEQALALEAAGRRERALPLLASVAASESASATLRARAAWRLGNALPAGPGREGAFQQAMRAGQVVRDESATFSIRPWAALRLAESAPQEADRRARGVELGRALLAGEWRDDLIEEEWNRIVGATWNLLVACQAQQEAQALRNAETAMRLQLDWQRELELELLPGLLRDAARARAGEPGLRHHERWGDPPLLLAYRLLPPIPRVFGIDPTLRSGGLVIGIRVDLDHLARDVLGPACGAFQVGQADTGAAVAVVDGRGQVVAYAGGGAAPDPEGAPKSGSDPVAEERLEPLHAWVVRVVRPADSFEAERWKNLALYGAFIALTLATAILGARATLRYVTRELELAQMKADFLSNITHELKTPLTSIKMYGEMLAMGRLKNDLKRKEYADHIVRESDRLQALIEEILDFARQDAGKGEKTYVLAEEDVADTVAEALDLFRGGALVRGFDLYVDLPKVGALPPVDLDREAIVRVVLNLLTNAAKYSGESRWIRLRVVREGREWIAVSVQDKGIGIAPEDQERLFERFFRAGDVETRAISGTGLGLSLCDQIVTAHQGEIDLESAKGKGSTFTVRLPIVADYRDQWPPPPPTESMLGGPGDSAGGQQSGPPGIPDPTPVPAPRRDPSSQGEVLIRSSVSSAAEELPPDGSSSAAEPLPREGAPRTEDTPSDGTVASGDGARSE